MALLLSGTVVQSRRTKGGKWQRVIVAGSSRVNDLLMVPADSAVATAEPGDTITNVPVRASVETSADGRPTRYIVFFADDGAVSEAGAA